MQMKWQLIGHWKKYYDGKLIRIVLKKAFDLLKNVIKETLSAHESKKPVSEKMETMTIIPNRSIKVSMSIHAMMVDSSGRYS